MYSNETLKTKTLSELEEIAKALGSELTAADGEQALIDFITMGMGTEGEAEEAPVKRKRTRISSKKEEPVYTVNGAEGENLDTPKKRRGRISKAEKAAEEAAKALMEIEATTTEPQLPFSEEVAEANETSANASETTSETVPGTSSTTTSVTSSTTAIENTENTEEQNVTPETAEAPKRRRTRKTKEEVQAAAAAAAEALAIANQKKAELEKEFIPEQAYSTEDAEPAVEENDLIAQLQAKVTAHNSEVQADIQNVIEDTVWEDDPGDGTDFIPVIDLPIDSYTTNLPYGIMDDPMGMANDSYGYDKEENKIDTRKTKEKEFDFDDLITVNGVLEVMPDGFGFLRSSDYNYLSSPDDVFVTVQQIKRHSLKTGDVVECTVRPPHEGEKFFPLTNVLKVNGCDPNIVRDRVAFENLTPLFPEEKFTLCGDAKTTNLSTRIVDLFSPIGKGQRALIVAQPKTGKTILMKDIANAISANHPEAYLMMLLIDERPEEVTDMARTVNAEVIASTFDEPAEHHVKIAGIVLEKAKRLVECGHDVVIFLDSITRLARAYNTVAPASGKILTGGVDANALQKPKRFFGAARNIEGGGSLTIIATALIDTGSKMDEVIFEEFKGTGNMELQLDRSLSNKRIFPAVNLVQSSTRRDDLLHDETTLNRMWILRKHIAEMNALEAMNLVHDRLERTKSNEEFLISMNS